jgi:hypothetical protein
MLSLRAQMESTYLIQRLSKPQDLSALGIKDNPFSFGGGYKNGGLSDEAMKYLRGIFSFDYMGAAEFEWGAVPEALNFIARTDLRAGQVKIGGKEIYYLCPVPYETEVKDRLKLLCEGKIQLHEWSGLEYKVGKDYVGGLEIDNGWFFFVDRTAFEKTCVLFGVKQ